MGNELDLIGDPTVLGWTTFGLYLIAAMLSFRAASASGPRGSPVFSYIWKLMAAILLVLGINKQLDLQTWMIELARRTVPKAHFQEYRVALHALCFFSLIFLIGVVLFRWPEKVKLFGRQLPMAATGCALVVTYILARAASIDHVDRVLGFDLERLPFLWVLETGGLALIIAQALGIITCAK